MSLYENENSYGAELGAEIGTSLKDKDYERSYPSIQQTEEERSGKGEGQEENPTPPDHRSLHYPKGGKNPPSLTYPSSPRHLVSEDGNAEAVSTPELDFSENAVVVLKKRYLSKNERGEIIETPKDLFWRVAGTVAKAEALYGASTQLIAEVETRFYKQMVQKNFMPNSPTLMNAGRKLGQLSACFVLPVEDSMDGIFDAVKSAALIHKSGGGTGFSFSKLRPKGDIVGSTSGVASGPVSFMQVFDTATEVIKQGGRRRGANMGILRVDHPDIEEFIDCKKDTKRFTNFNISVAVTDEFMRALEKDARYELVNPRTKEKVKNVNAREIFNRIVESAWETGEPGVIFIDKVNQYNPVPSVGEIEATNPCGEQPLLPYESCNLGSINLSEMYDGSGGINYDKLRSVVWDAVRFLDNVIDVNKYPLPEIEKNTLANRKIGLGVMGWADLLFQLNIPYDSEEAEQLAEKIMSFIQTESRKASADLARQRGNFPNYDKSIWKQPETPYMRNATTTTIAPTGTISIIAGCSSGIEPAFALAFVRRVLDGTEMIEVNKVFEKTAKARGFYSEELMKEIIKKGSLKEISNIPDDVKRVFVTAHDIRPEWHVRIQAAFQKYTDNAVSKTINFPSKATVEDVKKAYTMAYKLGCKGITVYRDGSRDQQVLSVAASTKTTSFPQVEPRPRPDVTKGVTMRINTGCGKLYVTINKDEYGICEVFAQIGKAGGCAYSQIEAVGRLISLAMRSGVKVESIIRQLMGIRCPSPSWQNGSSVLSCSDAIARALKDYITREENSKGDVFTLHNTGTFLSTTKEASQEHVDVSIYDLIESVSEKMGACPECGAAVEHEGGCIVCRSCGFSRCD